MKIYKIKAAYVVLSTLLNEKFPINVASGIYGLYRSLKDAISFSSEIEQRIAIRNSAKMVDGEIRFENEADAGKFRDEIERHYNEDLEIKVGKVTVNLSDLTGVMLAPNDFFALEGLVEFE